MNSYVIYIILFVIALFGFIYYTKHKDDDDTSQHCLIRNMKEIPDKNISCEVIIDDKGKKIVCVDEDGNSI